MQDAEPSLDDSAQAASAKSPQTADVRVALARLSPDDSGKIKNALAALEARIESRAQQPIPLARDYAGLKRLESRLNALVSDRRVSDLARSIPNSPMSPARAEFTCRESHQTVQQNSTEPEIQNDQVSLVLQASRDDIVTQPVNLDSMSVPVVVEYPSDMHASSGRKTGKFADHARPDPVPAIPSAISHLTPPIAEAAALKQSGVLARNSPDGPEAIAPRLQTVQDNTEPHTYSALNAIHETLKTFSARLSQLEEKIVEIQSADTAERQTTARHARLFEQHRINRIGFTQSASASQILSRPQHRREGRLGDDAIHSTANLNASVVAQGIFFFFFSEAHLFDVPSAASDRWQMSIAPDPLQSEVDCVIDVISAEEVEVPVDYQDPEYMSMTISESELDDYPVISIRRRRVSFLNHKLLLTLSLVIMLSIFGVYTLVQAINQSPAARALIMSQQVRNEATVPPGEGTRHIAKSPDARSAIIPNKLLDETTAGTGPTPIPAAGSASQASDSIRWVAALRKEAEAGDAIAQYELATDYAEGRLMERDFKLSAEWYEKAAMRGLAPAQYRIGSLYEMGVGVTRDLARARSWYEKAAGLGHARAMYNFAALLSQGADGMPDYDAAAVWFRKAAELGVRDSQYNLAILFARGLGVQQDFAQSYKWFAIAAAQGDEDASKRREIVAAKLSAKDLALAKAAAVAFRPREADRSANGIQTPQTNGRQGEFAASLMGTPVTARAETTQSAAFPTSLSLIDGPGLGDNTFGSTSRNSAAGTEVSACPVVTVWKKFNQFGRVDLTGGDAACK